MVAVSLSRTLDQSSISTTRHETRNNTRHRRQPGLCRALHGVNLRLAPRSNMELLELSCRGRWICPAWELRPLPVNEIDISQLGQEMNTDKPWGYPILNDRVRG